MNSNDTTWFDGMEKTVTEGVAKAKRAYAKAISDIVSRGDALFGALTDEDSWIELEERKIQARAAWQKALSEEQQWNTRCQNNGWTRPK